MSPNPRHQLNQNDLEELHIHGPKHEVSAGDSSILDDVTEYTSKADDRLSEQATKKRQSRSGSEVLSDEQEFKHNRDAMQNRTRGPGVGKQRPNSALDDLTSNNPYGQRLNRPRSISPSGDRESSKSATMASRTASVQSNHSQRDAPIKQSPWLVNRIARMLSSADSPPPKSGLQERVDDLQDEVLQLRRELQKKDDDLKRASKAPLGEIKRLQQKYQYILDANQQFQTEKEELEARLNQMYHEREQSRHAYEDKIHRLKSEMKDIQHKYENTIRTQQEEAFKLMESGRWLPSEESKVIGDLERLKREMRSWAKSNCIKDPSKINGSGESESDNLSKYLSPVVVLENNQLHPGLCTQKGLVLLLNALLAHDVYTSLFQNPFFFLNDGLGKEASPRRCTDEELNLIYTYAQRSNREDAHIWRSQTLRLLLPPVRDDSKDGVRAIRKNTEDMISLAAQQQAAKFLDSPARNFINSDAEPDHTLSLKKIYHKAATLSYQLWTRRIAIRCSTLKDLDRPVFDIDNPLMKPHPLVRYDDHDDQLKDRPITVIVHPLVQAFGTDEAKDYDRSRVWVPAEVWLNSKLDAAES